jgi:hypothetical protein
MMLSTILLAASAQVYGTNIPDHFRNADWRAYVRCVRSEVNAANEAWREPDPAAPTVVKFGQLITHCGAERSLAIFALRGFIQTRHRDWSPEQVAQSAEFVLSGFELEQMIDRRGPFCSTHEMPCEEF